MISLKPLQLADIPKIREWAAAPTMGDFFRRFLPAFAWPADDATVLSWFPSAFAIRENDSPLGLITFFNLNQPERKVEFGLLIDKQRGERGSAAVEACRQSFDLYFDFLGLERIYCTILAGHEHLGRILGQWNFKEEGRFRSSIWIKGKPHDEIVYGLLKAEHALNKQPKLITKEAS